MRKAIKDQFNEYLLRSFELAELAKGLGDGPFGAVILDESLKVFGGIRN